MAIAIAAIGGAALGAPASAATRCRVDAVAQGWKCVEGWNGKGNPPPQRYAIYKALPGLLCEGKVHYQVKWFEADGTPITEEDKDPLDNLYAFACIGPPTTTIRAWMESVAPRFEVGHSPKVRGLVNLETWVWYEGDTEFAPESFTYVDPVGIPITTELRGHIEEYEWDFGDGPDSVFVTTDPGSGDDIDNTKVVSTGGSQAAEHIWKQPGQYTMTATARWKGEDRQSDGFITTGWAEIPGHVEIEEIWGPVDVITIRSDLTHRGDD